MRKAHLKYYNQIMFSLAKSLQYKANKRAFKKDSIFIDSNFCSFLRKKFSLNGRFKSSLELEHYFDFHLENHFIDGKIGRLGYLKFRIGNSKSYDIKTDKGVITTSSYAMLVYKYARF
jgi:hypothetical protein